MAEVHIDNHDDDELRRYSVGEQRGCSFLSMVLVFIGALLGVGIAYLIVVIYYALTT